MTKSSVDRIVASFRKKVCQKIDSRFLPDGHRA